MVAMGWIYSIWILLLLDFFNILKYKMRLFLLLFLILIFCLFGNYKENLKNYSGWRERYLLGQRFPNKLIYSHIVIYIILLLIFIISVNMIKRR
jgi:hypothetical protein